MRHGPTRARTLAPHEESGFTLVEVLLAFFLIALGLLAAAPMFVYGVKVTASSADIGTLSARAVTKLETFRKTGFNALTAGGSTTTNVAGYFDTSDPAVTLRWSIVNDTVPTRKKTITIVAISKRTTGMGQKTVRLVTVRSA